MLLLRQREPRLSAVDRHDLVAVPFQQQGKDAANRLTILYDQDRPLGRRAGLLDDAAGSVRPQHRSSLVRPCLHAHPAGILRRAGHTEVTRLPTPVTGALQPRVTALPAGAAGP